MTNEFYIRCNDELNNQIIKYSLEGIQYNSILYILFTDYDALLCDKAYCYDLRRTFRTKRDILKKMIKKCI